MVYNAPEASKVPRSVRTYWNGVAGTSCAVSCLLWKLIVCMSAGVNVFYDVTEFVFEVRDPGVVCD